MKKILVRIVIGILALIVVAALAAHFFLDGAIKRGVEIIGPKLTQTDVKLEQVNISLLSGSGRLRGFVVGNPQGYKTASAINVGVVSVAVQPASLLSKKMVVKSVNIDSAELTLEGGLKDNNLNKILANVQATSGGSSSTTNAKSSTTEKSGGKKIEVDDFVMTGTKVHLKLNVPGLSGTISLPPIHLTNLGKDSDGITAGQLSEQVLKAVVADVGKAVEGAAGNVGKTATEEVGKATKSIGDIFKKKN
jgi:uncharacterized protein involved in outer membrane biogenesis